MAYIYNKSAMLCTTATSFVVGISIIQGDRTYTAPIQFLYGSPSAPRPSTTLFFLPVLYFAINR